MMHIDQMWIDLISVPAWWKEFFFAKHKAFTYLFMISFPSLPYQMKLYFTRFFFFTVGHFRT